MIKEISQLQLIFVLWIDQFWFYWVARKFRKLAKTGKKLYGSWSTQQKFSVSGELLEYLIFFKWTQHKIMHLEIQLILFLHSLGVTLKNMSIVKKRSESVKNDTKARITRVWFKLRPKLFHQQLPLKGCVQYIVASFF